MALSKHKLGEFIELLDNRNVNLEYGPDDVRGVNNLKQLMPTKADISGRDLTKFQIVHPGDFVFNHRTSRNGSKFSIAYNDLDFPVICTEDYVVFRIKPVFERELHARWLYMFFNRPEFDRYVITNSWGSSTEFYNWEDICEVVLALPSLDIQSKYVDIYNAMLDNQRVYESGLEDMKLIIDSIIDQHKNSAQRVPLRCLLRDTDKRNDSGDLDKVYGITMAKKFIPSVANLEGVDLSRYKVVLPGQLASNFMHVGRDESLPIAINSFGNALLVSPAYFVFDTMSPNCIAEYILMWLSRDESGRYCWYISDTSVRGGFSLDCFYDMEIPVLPLSVQASLVGLYKAYVTRMQINEQLKAQIKELCPILIKGSLEEGAQI